MMPERQQSSHSFYESLFNQSKNDSEINDNKV